MRNAQQHSGHGTLHLMIGLALALALTLLSFGLVAFHLLSPGASLAVIAVAALVQILVHLRYFLHLGLGTTPREALLAIAFTAIVVVLMIGGSAWIMFNLYGRMMGS